MLDVISSPLLLRAAVGLVIAAAIALAARRAGSLSGSGAVAATVTGALCTAAGAGWGILLIVYFIAASLLSRYGRQEKERLVGGVVAKAGPRDATQVFANGGIYTACLAFAVFHSDTGLTQTHLLALGALAASSADTWATEIGTLHGGTPRSVFGFRRVAPGTSGAITAVGCGAMIAGAALVAGVAMLLGLGSMPVAVIIGGVAGATTDTLLGAAVQERRWCPTCSMATERSVHDCGTATTPAGGAAWMNNDTVNLLATLVGGAVAVLLANL